MSPSNCGCEPGHFLCATAIALWDSVNACYSAALQTGEFQFYEKARTAYYDHFAQGDNTS